MIYLPLENLEERYTVMMNDSIRPHVDKVLYPNIEDRPIQTGEFLDVNRTIKFKAAQLQMVSDLFDSGQVKDGEVFLVGDIYFPGISAIKYMAELQGIKVRVVGWSFAGSADPNDFVRNLGQWSLTVEKGFYEVCDEVYVGSEWLKKQIKLVFGNNIGNKCRVTGYPWNTSWYEEVHSHHFIHPRTKKSRVIWPHRMCAEKGVEEMFRFAQLNPDLDVLVTSCGKRDRSEQYKGRMPANVKYLYGLSKRDYLEILSDSKFYLSTAKQETFGYTLQEAILYGCFIAVPNRVCYPEMVPKKCLYNNIEKVKFHPVEKSYTLYWDYNYRNIIEHNENL